MRTDKALGASRIFSAQTAIPSEIHAPDTDIAARIGETAASTPPVGRDSNLRAFLSISAAITGVPESKLPARAEQTMPTGQKSPLYEIYFERLREAFPNELRQLLQLWVRLGPDDPHAPAKLAAELGKADDAALALRRGARQVAKIWLLSTIDDPQSGLDQNKGTSKAQLGGGFGQHQLAVIFPLIGAPAPGYSNLPHGYWSDVPPRFAAAPPVSPAPSSGGTDHA